MTRDPEARARQLAQLRPAPPAPMGNTRGMTHGAKRTWRSLPEGKLKEVFGALAQDAPLRDPATGELPAADRVVVELLALALVRLESVTAWVEQHGEIDARTGKPRPAVEYERRLRLEALSHCESLGMTPRSRAKLGLDLAQTVTAQDRLEHHVEQTYGGQS